MFTGETWTAVSSAAAALTALFTLIAAAIAARAARHAYAQTEILKQQIDSHKTARLTEIHSRFQSQVRDIQRSFPPEVNEDHWVPTKEHERSISIYWYLVFDEWLTCTKLSPDLLILWSDQYSKGVKSALRIPAFRRKIEELFAGESTFLGYGSEFRSVIEAICEDSIGRKLRVV